MEVSVKIHAVFVPLLWVEPRDGREVEMKHSFLPLLRIEDMSIPWVVYVATDVSRLLTISDEWNEIMITGS
jgi:hypothetical protein